MFRSKAEQKVAEAGLRPGAPPARPVPHGEVAGPPRRQRARAPISRPGTSASSGEVEKPIRLTWEELKALPSTEITIDIHCVTRWSRFDTTFRGVHWRSSRARAAEAECPLRRRARGAGLHRERAARGARGRERADRLRGRRRAADPRSRLAAAAGVPSATSGRARSGCAGIELLDDDQPGFWERYGYHNDADYWKEERYGF